MFGEIIKKFLCWILTVVCVVVGSLSVFFSNILPEVSKGAFLLIAFVEACFTTLSNNESLVFLRADIFLCTTAL